MQNAENENATLSGADGLARLAERAQPGPLGDSRADLAIALAKQAEGLAVEALRASGALDSRFCQIADTANDAIRKIAALDDELVRRIDEVDDLAKDAHLSIALLSDFADRLEAVEKGARPQIKASAEIGLAIDRARKSLPADEAEKFSARNLHALTDPQRLSLLVERLAQRLGWLEKAVDESSASLGLEAGMSRRDAVRHMAAEVQRLARRSRMHSDLRDAAETRLKKIDAHLTSAGEEIGFLFSSGSRFDDPASFKINSMLRYTLDFKKGVADCVAELRSHLGIEAYAIEGDGGGSLRKLIALLAKRRREQVRLTAQALDRETKLVEDNEALRAGLAEMTRRLHAAETRAIEADAAEAEDSRAAALLGSAICQAARAVGAIPDDDCSTANAALQALAKMALNAEASAPISAVAKLAKRGRPASKQSMVATLAKRARKPKAVR